MRRIIAALIVWAHILMGEGSMKFWKWNIERARIWNGRLRSLNKRREG